MGAAELSEKSDEMLGGGGGGLCDGLAFHPRGSNDTPGHFILRKLGETLAWLHHLARVET